MFRARAVLLILLAALVAGCSAQSPGESEGGLLDAVTSSLQPGGEAYEAARGLNATRPVGADGESDDADLAFGPPLRYEHLDLSGDDAGAEVLGSADFITRRPSYLSVAYLDGAAVSAIEVDETGAFVAGGGWLDEEVQAMALLADGVVIATDQPGWEAYVISPGLETVTALNLSTRDLIGSEPVGVAEFRVFKAEQRAALEAAAPEEAPRDAVPGPIAAALGNSVVMAGAALTFLLGSAALLLRAHRHAKDVDSKRNGARHQRPRSLARH